jgi:hypothetical protein
MKFALKNIFFILMAFLLVFNFGPVYSAGFNDIELELTSNRPLVSGSQTLSFKAGSSGLVKQINLQYAKTYTNWTKPSSLNLYSTNLSILFGLDDNKWSIDKTSYETGLIKLVSSEGQEIEEDTFISFTLTSVGNPEIGDCSGEKKMFDTCYLFFRSFSDEGETSIDNGSVAFNIEDEPYLYFSVEGVGEDFLTNGFSTTVSSSYDSIGFGKLEIRKPERAAHRLRVETTAANGYAVYVKLNGYLQGLKPDNKIDPFAGGGATWDNPKNWVSPTSTTKNSDTGWIGANTNDLRVPGWIDGEGKFAPLSSISRPVMSSLSKDYGSDVFVTYCIEVNEYQPYDSYAGSLTYEVLPLY